jgi:hypothetical protein
VCNKSKSAGSEKKTMLESREGRKKTIVEKITKI